MPAFIKDVIKGLKDNDGYGTPLILGYRLPGVLNVKTGRQEQTVKEILVELAIRLPNRMSEEFLQSIGVVKTNDVITGSVQILVDRDDIPDWFQLKAPNSFAMYNSRKYTVLKTDVYDEAVVLFVKDVGAVEPSNTLDSGLAFRHTLTVTVN